MSNKIAKVLMFSEEILLSLPGGFITAANRPEQKKRTGNPGS